MAHQHGSMDITEQQKTFHGFLRAAMLVAGGSVLVLLILTTRI